MPTEKGNWKDRIAVEGSFRVSCEDFHFRLRYCEGTGVADFPSLGMLARAGKMAKEIDSIINSLPPLPPAITFFGSNRQRKKVSADLELLVAVKSRPVGKVSFGEDKPKFIPTPLRFFKKV